jgi:hypothetical protein
MDGKSRIQTEINGENGGRRKWDRGFKVQVQVIKEE